MPAELTFTDTVQTATPAYVASAYGNRYGQWKGTTQRYTTEDRRAVVTVTFNR